MQVLQVSLAIAGIIAIIYFSDRQEKVKQQLRMLEPLVPQYGLKIPEGCRTFANDDEFYTHMRLVVKEMQEKYPDEPRFKPNNEHN